MGAGSAKYTKCERAVEQECCERCGKSYMTILEVTYEIEKEGKACAAKAARDWAGAPRVAKSAKPVTVLAGSRSKGRSEEG
eukprot:CAMPEP_0181443782 /NCGR_PEP_ID=MMETSP1110-20121109/24729_1 /TAXON_ID=174948 /ORGANISM="Symbiodinium sp., Strain CCMP421" /LENGTH=80 /DNA_ID=CAMNT_0023567765 /DNA_START=58 /DNA_END=301 /DNA_ORIENTATION=-